MLNSPLQNLRPTQRRAASGCTWAKSDLVQAGRPNDTNGLTLPFADDSDRSLLGPQIGKTFCKAQSAERGSVKCSC